MAPHCGVVCLVWSYLVVEFFPWPGGHDSVVVRQIAKSGHIGEQLHQLRIRRELPTPRLIRGRPDTHVRYVTL